MTDEQDMGQDFLADLEKLKVNREKKKAPTFKKKKIPEVELTDEQKRIVVEYLLSSIGKGFFENVSEFWASMGPMYSDIEEVYPAMRQAVEKFVEQCKYYLLATIGEA